MSVLGMVVQTSWNEVTINWDDGHTASIQHNDMARVTRNGFLISRWAHRY